MNIKFIVPKNQDHYGQLFPSKEGRPFPPFGLARMTAIAPIKHRVTYHDERTETVGHHTHADIAIIFINNYNRSRAYELAQTYRKRGAFVVFTGAILETAPEDAFLKADCLFIGDGEAILQNFLTEFENGHKRHLYGNVFNPVKAGATKLKLVS